MPETSAIALRRFRNVNVDEIANDLVLCLFLTHLHQLLVVVFRRHRLGA